jgi:hypothetical protein
VFLRLPGLKNRNNIELFLSIKINPMKIQIIILSAMVLVSSCNTNPKPSGTPTDSTRMAADTAGLAQFQAMKAQNELGIQKEEKQDESSSKEVKKNSNTSTSSSNNKSEQVGNATSTTSTEKKGWSKTAKGAVIGGVAGAAGGAVINKKNRAAGAVIGGVIGAGTGAVIGNEMDKKDGRH